MSARSIYGGPKAIRLPPLKTLRVHSSKRENENPCIAVMSNVLACWASAGYSAPGCAIVENQLRECMDSPPSQPVKSSSINHHLSRMKKHLISSPRHK